MAQEIERKFLVLDDSFKHEAFSKSHIQQGYICSERGRTVRIRIKDNRAYLTIKGPSENGGLTRYEFEREIPLEDGQQMMQFCEPGIIDKTRWLVKSGKHTFEVDEFFGDNEGLVVAEVELSYEDEPYKKPHFIGKEVTGDRRYYNSQLRLCPFNKWK
jgi:CYTH domain-containing protein